MQENNLKSLHKYFENYSSAQIPELQIIKFRAYDIKLLGSREFEMLYCYIDEKDNNSFVIMRFYLNKVNNLKITNIVSPLEVTEFEISKKEVEQIFPRPVKGNTPIDYNTAKTALKDYIKKE